MTRTLSVRTRQHLTPQFEQLEDRCVPAAYLNAGSLVIDGTNANDNVTVNNYTSGGIAYYRVSFNGTNQNFRTTQVTTGNCFFNGNNGNDYFSNNVASLHAVAHGGAGNDTMYGDNATDWIYGDGDNDVLYGWGGNDVVDGGTGNDTCYGGGGTDWVYGGADNDRIYGGTEYDYMYGQAGNDVIDAGSAGEFVDGGTGTDINAWMWAIGGASYTDVFQGSGPTCWLDSAISSAAFHGVDFAGRISYLGNHTYRVGLFNSAGAWTTEDVFFDGTVNGHDAQLNPNQEGEFWALLVQRAYLESRGLSTTNAPSGWADTSLQAFTGRTASTFAANDVSRIMNALNANQNVVADTRDSAAALSTNMLVPWHQYTVLRVETVVTYQTINLPFGGSYQIPIVNYFVVMRNPWGRDGGATTWGNANDGEVRVSWADFTASMDAVIIG